MFYLMMHPTHFSLQLYGIRHMVKDHSAREETRSHMGYSFWLATRVVLYVPSQRQDNTYHSLCYIIHGALAETRNRSMGSPWRISLTTHCTMSKWLEQKIVQFVHHEGSIQRPIYNPLPGSYILPQTGREVSCGENVIIFIFGHARSQPLSAAG